MRAGIRRALQLWIAGRRRFITIPERRDRQLLELWIAGRRRFITIKRAFYFGQQQLWIAGRRRFITMPPLQLTDNFAVVGE